MKTTKIFQYPACSPYPNLCFEIQLKNAGHIDTYCRNANITNNVMTNILNGKDDFSFDEKYGLIRGYWYTGIDISYDYLFNNKLSFYDLKKPKHYHKFLLIYSKLDILIKNPLVRTNFMYRFYYVKLSEYIKQRYVSRAEYNRLVHLLHFCENITNKPKPRNR